MISYFHLIIIAILGFSSGLPLALTGSALQGWLAEENVSIVTIGMLGLVTQPYIFKFLWAPLIDRYSMPFLGYRTGWIFFMQLALVLAIIAIAFCDPMLNPMTLAILAVIIAFLSATQDLAFDAYRTELLTEQERGLGAVVYVYSFRVAMIISGGGSLLLSYYIGWRTTYVFMAVLIGLCSFATLFAQDKNREKNNIRTLRQAVVEPFQEFFSRKNGQSGCNAALLLILVLTYKLGEALSTALTTPLLIKTLNFTTQDVGLVFKTMGTVAVLVGLSVGGSLINRLGLYSSLFWFGVLQALSILLYLWLLYAGHNYPVMAFTILIEQFSSGISTAAFMVLLMALCNQKYTATQFALFSALASVGRVYASPVAGYFVAAYGWEMFFIFSFVMCLPSLFILKFLKQDILTNRFSVISPI